MIDARLQFLSRLLGDVLDMVDPPRRDLAEVIGIAIGREVDLLVEQVGAAEFRRGIEAAQAVANPDAELTALRERREATLQNMLEAFVQMQPDAKH
jgi:hypothetical protein